ncbi:MAG: DUF2585 family protein [Planctomycetaceae bacterium]|nr:DUF2585 family protein [Planctomycetaceae bacterium]
MTVSARPLDRRQFPIVWTLGLFPLTAVILWGLGRLWWCACGEWFLVTGDANGSHTSQHLLDPFSFTHVLHGFLFWWIVHYLVPGLVARWQMFTVMALEAAWEVLENTPLVIDRYRTATIALGYEGDTIVNSLADLACCWTGAILARCLGFRWSLTVFLATELVLAWWIRDGLLLNIVMLVYPIDAVLQWQAGQ